MTTQEDSIGNVPIIVILLLLAIALILAILLLSFGPTVTMTAALLAAVWAFDVALKSVLNFGNATAPADLSFSAFVFSVGQAISLISADNVDPSPILEFGVLAFVLLLVWLSNLFFCGRLDQRQRKESNANNDKYWEMSERFG